MIVIFLFYIKKIELKEGLKEQSDDSPDVFKRNIIDRYTNRSVCGKFVYLKNVSLRQFAAYYYTKSIFEIDYQPDVLEEDISNEDIDFPI